MRKFQITSGTTAAVAASLVLLAACGGGGGDDAPAASTADTTAATTSTTLEASTTTTVGTTTTTTVIATAARLDNLGIGKCVKDTGAATATVTDQCFNNGDPQAYWKIIGYGNGQFAYQNQATQKCLAVAGGSTTTGADVSTVACDGSTQTLFTNPPSTFLNAANAFNLANVASTQCAEVQNVNNVNGGKVTQWTCGTNQGNQTWRQTVLVP